MDLEPVQTDPKKTQRLRSPAYPGINLEAALKRAREFYAKERRNAANVKVAVQNWGFKPTSGGGFIVVAALKSFGLITEEGSGDARTIRLSDLGLRILLDERPESPDRDAAIKKAALNPKIHAQLWSQHGADLPSDANLRHELIFNSKFNENSVDDFIREYKDTIGYAKLTNSDTLPAGAEDKSKQDEEEHQEEDNGSGDRKLAIGDYVQWESGGVFQFTKPQRIRSLAPDGKWAFVEGSNTGVPIEQLTREKPLEQITPKPAPVSTTPPIDIEQKSLLAQELVISIPRKFRVDIDVRGDELKREDLTKIKNQFTRWIEGLEEAFD